MEHDRSAREPSPEHRAPPVFSQAPDVTSQAERSASIRPEFRERTTQAAGAISIGSPGGVAVAVREAKPIPHLIFQVEKGPKDFSTEAAAPPGKVMMLADDANGGELRYMVVTKDHLGAGTYGKVVKAWMLDEAGIGEYVAMKEGTKVSLKDEARTALQLEQAFGKDSYLPRMRAFEEARNILVMDLVPGKSLDSVLDKRGGTMPTRELMPLLRDMCGAMLEMQERGFVVTDANPGNLRVSTDKGGVHFEGFYDHGAVMPIADLRKRSKDVQAAPGFTDPTIFLNLSFGSIKEKAAAERMHVQAMLAHMKNAMTGDALDGTQSAQKADTKALEDGLQRMSGTAKPEEMLAYAALTEYFTATAEAYRAGSYRGEAPVSLARMYDTLQALTNLMDGDRAR